MRSDSVISTPVVIHKLARGRVRIWKIFDRGCYLHEDRKNLIVYTGANAFARMAAGTAGYAVGGMYFQFRNLSDPGDPLAAITPAKADDISIFTAAVDPNDYMRQALVLQPGFSTSDPSLYSGNQVTFYGSTPEGTGENGTTFAQSSNSAVHGAGLIVMPSPTDKSQDILFARVGVTKLLMQSGMRVGVEWSVQFLAS